MQVTIMLMSSISCESRPRLQLILARYVTQLVPEKGCDVVHLVEALALLPEEGGLLVDELLLRQLPRHQLLDQDRLRRLVVAVCPGKSDHVFKVLVSKINNFTKCWTQLTDRASAARQPCRRRRRRWPSARG